MQKPEEMHVDWRYARGTRESHESRPFMKLAACISIALTIASVSSAPAATEQCRFIEAKLEREACYQRQEAARAARQKALETQRAAQPKSYEPVAPEDVELAKAIRGICRGC